MTDQHLIICRFNRATASVERDLNDMDRKSTLSDIYTGQVEDVERVIAFNVAEGWSRDVTEDVAREIVDKAVNEDFGKIPSHLVEFVEHQLGCQIVADLAREYA